MAATSAPVAERPTKWHFDRETFQTRARQRGAETVDEQAARVGLTRQHLHKIFNDDHTPTIDTLDRMQAFLDLPIDAFFRRA